MHAAQFSEYQVGKRRSQGATSAGDERFVVEPDGQMFVIGQR